MPFRHRMVMVLFAVMLSLMLFRQGHGISRERSPMAFLHSSTASVAVKIKGGTDVSAGIHLYADGTTVGDVIIMTAGTIEVPVSVHQVLQKRLQNGDVLEWERKDGKIAGISVSKMKTWEKMLLEIPLDPDKMEASDWEILPGIGPGLSKKIVEDRQKNGDFCTIGSLVRVEGLGEEKLKGILMYF